MHVYESILKWSDDLVMYLYLQEYSMKAILYSLKFSRKKYFVVLPNSAQKQILRIKFSWYSFQPRLASIMNLKFRGRNFSHPFSDLQKISTSKILGYTVTKGKYHIAETCGEVFRWIFRSLPNLKSWRWAFRLPVPNESHFATNFNACQSYPLHTILLVPS